MDKQTISRALFCQRFSEVFDASNETIYTISEKLSLSPSTISRYLNGKMLPKIPTLYMMADIFRVNPLWLMGYEAEEKYAAPLPDAEELPPDGKRKTAPSISDEAMKLAADYDSLDQWGRKQIRAVTDNELARLKAYRLEIQAAADSGKAERVEYIPRDEVSGDQSDSLPL